MLLIMMDCSEWEELNAKFRIAILRYNRFMDTIQETGRTDEDKEEAGRLENEMNRAEWAMTTHQQEHGCRG